jgi:ATP-dependent Lon protease
MPGRKSNSKQPKKNSSNDDDDSSVDSKGNIRDLIEYEEDEDDDYSPSESSESNIAKRVKKRTSGEKKKFAPKKFASGKKNPFQKDEKKRKTSDKVSAHSEKVLTQSEKKSPSKMKKKSKKVESEDEEMDEDEEEDEEEDDEENVDEEDDEEEDDEDEDEDMTRTKATIDWLVLGDDAEDPNEPKKYKMKKESPSVRRFVEILQKHSEGEEEHIDNDITYFKTLTQEKQNVLLLKMENRLVKVEQAVPLKFQILDKSTTPEIQGAAMSKYQAMTNIDPSSTEYYKCNHWINGFIRLPLGIYKNLPVSMEDGAEKCSQFVSSVQKCMDAAIYGQDEAKLQILQFISTWIANPKSAGNVLSIHGAAGIGKTTLVKEGIAKALDRPFHFITLGGATDASYLDGHSYTYEGSTWGRIVEVLMQSNCMNPVIYFDELDKVSETPKGEEIINLLIHLTDGAQNDKFQDKYFTGIDLDLSRCLFIFSHNDDSKVNPILKNRMYNIHVNGFNLKEKTIIAENYLLPAALKDMNLFEKVSFPKEVIKHVIEHHTAGEPGVREMKRCLQTIVSKINLLRFYNDGKAVPFSIPNFQLPFTVTKEHVEIFLKKKPSTDPSIAHLYT